MRAYVDRPRSLGELLRNSRDRNADQPALCTPSSTLTYGELYRDAMRFSSGLLSEVYMVPGDRIALLLPNQAEWVIAFFGAMLAGVVVVPLDARLTPRECQQLLADSRAAAVVTTHDLWKQLRAPDLPAVRAVIAVDSDEGIDAAFSLRQPSRVAHGFNGPSPRPATEDDVAAIFYTSGSTGSSKGAVLTHSNIIHAALSARLCVDLDAASRNLIVAPLSHVAPCNAQLVATISAGGRADLLSSFNVEGTLDWIARRHVTHFFGVPAMYELLLAHPGFGESRLPALRSCAYGGAPCSPDLGRRLRSALPQVRLGHGFGLTETSSVASFLPDELVDDKPTSVGIPCPVNDVRIVDDSGGDVPRGQPGELLIAGPTVFSGYEAGQDGTTLLDGWLRTGDVARMDSDGCIYIVDRMKDMIIRGGENIYCIEVENVLQSHPAVAEAALVGVPDRVMGEEGKAVVVPENGASVSPHEIRQFCGYALARFKVPKYVEVRYEALPRGRTGKVVKEALRHSAAS